MNTKLKNSLLSAAIMALFAAPAWATTDDADRAISADPTPQVETGQPMDAAPAPDYEPQAGTDYGTTASDNELYASTPAELRGVEVRDVDGKKVGTIKAVVAEQGHETAHAVVSAGGFLGLGAREIIVSLDEMERVEDDKLQVSITRDELEARGDYQPERYVELEPEKPIHEFSAFEPMSEDAPPAMGAPATPQERQ